MELYDFIQRMKYLKGWSYTFGTLEKLGSAQKYLSWMEQYHTNFGALLPLLFSFGIMM